MIDLINLGNTTTSWHCCIYFGNFLWHGVANAFCSGRWEIPLDFPQVLSTKHLSELGSRVKLAHFECLQKHLNTHHILLVILHLVFWYHLLCFPRQGFPQMQCIFFIHASCVAASGMHVCCTRQESFPTFCMPCHSNAVEKGNTSTPLIPYGWYHSSNGMSKVQMKCRNEEPSGTWILGLEREWTCTFYAIAVSAVMGLFASVNALSKPSILTSICTAGFILPWMDAG